MATTRPVETPTSSVGPGTGTGTGTTGTGGATLPRTGSPTDNTGMWIVAGLGVAFVVLGLVLGTRRTRVAVRRRIK